jgi:hypothetical protein
MWSRKSRVIPLFPPWAVRPVQSLSACTRVHFTFTFLPCILCILVEIKLYAIDLHGYLIEFCTGSSHIPACCKCFQSRFFLPHFSPWMCLPYPNSTAFIMCEVWFVITQAIYFTLDYKLAWKLVIRNKWMQHENQERIGYELHRLCLAEW